MGIFGDIARHLGTEAFTDLAMSREQRREKAKWGAIFAVFALLSLVAFWVQGHAKSDADLLGGHKTIERFMHANVAAMALALLSVIGFIILCFKTWKGRDGSIYQLIYTIGAGVIIVFCTVSVFRSIHNIQKDLNSPLTVTSENYVLCRSGRNYLLVFDEKGTNDSILLIIPKEKYDELKGGTPSNKGYLSRSRRLIENSQYTEYEDTQFYETPIDITYYEYSVIYEDCKFTEQQENQVV